MYSFRRAAGAFFAALMLFAVLALCACGGDTFSGAEIEPTAAPTEAPECDDMPDARATFREATLYYLSDEGYVVPVKKLIPWEEGIARACLACITSTPVNDAAAAKLGLKTVLPAGTEFTLSIVNGEAKLDLKNAVSFGSLELERAALDAVVSTLTEFATVDCVTVTVGGAGGSLPCGAELPVREEGRLLNIEQSELAASAGGAAGTLYFPNSSGALTVPVTRFFSREPSVYTVVSALIAGPEGRGLMCCFPQGTLLLGAVIENGTATVNLSQDFEAVRETEGLYELARDTLLMTLSKGFDAERIVIEVNGRVFEG